MALAATIPVAKLPVFSKTEPTVFAKTEEKATKQVACSIEVPVEVPSRLVDIFGNIPNTKGKGLTKDQVAKLFALGKRVDRVEKPVCLHMGAHKIARRMLAGTEGERVVAMHVEGDPHLGKGKAKIVYQGVGLDGAEFAVGYCNLKKLDEPMSRSIVREIQYAPKIRGQNVVNTHFVVVDGDDVYFVMEACKKDVSFYDILQKIADKELLLAKRVEYCRDLARGLDEIHSQGLIHRDIGLENILIGKDGRLKLSDFGYVIKADDPDRGVDQCGNVVYAAPERYQAKIGEDLRNKTTQASDVWAIGVFIYNLLTTNLLDFQYDDVIAREIVCAMGKDWQPPIPHDTNPAVRTFLLQLLSMDPAKRPTAKQILQRLDTLFPRN